MTYLLRGLSLSLAAFFLIYLLLSVLLICAWPMLRRRWESLAANSLLGLRLLPLAGAAATVVFIIIPSFIHLEPRGAEEAVGSMGVLLAAGGMIVIAVGIGFASRALWNTCRFVSSYVALPPIGIATGRIATEVIDLAIPAVLVAGIWRPKLLISRGARELLDDSELSMAILHEIAHVRRADNLRKLALCLCRFPLLADIDRKWVEATELEADDSAVTDEAAAIDLASAVLKTASAQGRVVVPELAMSLAADRDQALRARVERLLAWKPHVQNKQQRLFHFMIASVPAVVVLAVSYWSLLVCAHELTELLIR